jgi:PIN domain nuclease of toxin-antitoxin system
MALDDAFVLDTSALLALRGAEPGADRVDKLTFKKIPQEMLTARAR